MSDISRTRECNGKIFCRVLEETMNKSSINQFKNFIERYSDVTKWFMCSDYCFDDKSKANNVVSLLYILIS